MQIPNDLWQGAYQCGQNGFIHENLLLIGYFAWQGFMQFGPGLTVCDLDASVMDYPSNRQEIVPFATEFIVEAKGVKYLQQEEIENDAIALIQSAVRHYDPKRALILVLSVHSQLEILLLQNLAITPPECHTHVCNRWEEFMPGKMLMDRRYRGKNNV